MRSLATRGGWRMRDTKCIIEICRMGMGQRALRCVYNYRMKIIHKRGVCVPFTSGPRCHFFITILYYIVYVYAIHESRDNKFYFQTLLENKIATLLCFLFCFLKRARVVEDDASSPRLPIKAIMPFGGHNLQ